jgi:hypothetical protein
MCREMDVWVEDEPPTTAVVSGPSRNQSVPSTITFSFASLSAGGVETPISRSLCRLVQLSTAVAQQQASSPTPVVSLPGSSVRPATGSSLQRNPSDLSQILCRLYPQVPHSTCKRMVYSIPPFNLSKILCRLYRRSHVQRVKG